jgi:hypothetical protein
MHKIAGLGSQFLRDNSTKISRNLFKKSNKPWMKAKELDIITEIIYRLQPETCFEWGSGFSTLMFPGLLPNMKSWHSLEHNKSWYDFIAGENKDPRVSITLVEPDNPEYITRVSKYDEKKEGLPEDFRTYIEFPSGLGIKFDFIFIDGRARRECIKLAFTLASPDGVVIVHDANRDSYFTDLPPFSSTLLLQDYRHHRKAGGIWVGKINGDISDILDVAHHKKVWKQHEILAKILFLR